jgi:hypothetical protein
VVTSDTAATPQPNLNRRGSFRMSMHANNVMIDYKACCAIVADLKARNPFYREHIAVGRSTLFMRHEALLLLNAERVCCWT